MVRGTDWFRRSFVRSRAKTERICSKRRATSRPFFSPASVMTVKWVEWTSSHGGSAAVEKRDDSRTIRSEQIWLSEMDLERIGVTTARELLSRKCYHVGADPRMAPGHKVEFSRSRTADGPLNFRYLLSYSQRNRRVV